MEKKVFRPRLTESENNVILAMRGEKELNPTSKINKKELTNILETEKKYADLVDLLSTSGMFECYDIHPSDIVTGKQIGRAHV